MNDWNKTSVDEDAPKSRTQIKREVEALQDLGKKLLELKPDALAQLNLSDRMLAAIEESKRITQNEAKRRHLQFIGKLMRDVDEDQVRAVIERQEAGTKAHTQHFHQMEIWRDRLIADKNNDLQAFVDEYPAADRQHLRQLVRNAQKELEKNKPPASARKLFKYIRELHEATEQED